MSFTPHNEDRRLIADLIQQLRTRPLAQQTWPPGKHWLTLPELLVLHAPDMGAQLERAAVLADAVFDVPLIAVAGLNDQGKSSLVASFLSPDGAGRVLRGTALRQATYRFTLWLPASWGADQKLRAVLDKALAGVFGNAPEPLPLDATAALAAQNANASLDIPLVAWDARLDELKIGLLDCPDIQKRPPNAEAGSADRRLELLKRAGSLCAATIIVAKHENATTREFQQVNQALPGNLHIFAFNQVRSLAPRELLAELREALQLPSDTPCFAAYDYDLRCYETRTPLWDPNRRALAGKSDCFPCFFRLAENEAESSPERITEDRSLHQLAKNLDPKVLVRDFHLETRRRLNDAGRTALHAIKQGTAGQEERLSKTCTQVWESCHESLKGKDGQRIILSPQMAQDFADSIIRCAPWYIKGPLKVKAGIAWGAGHLIHFGRRLTPDVVARFGRTIGIALSRAKGAFTDSGAGKAAAEEPIKDVFSRLLLTRWRTSGYRIDEVTVRGAADRIVERFNEVGLNNLSQEKWDAISRSFWEQAPKGKAAVTTGLSLLAALGVAIFTALHPLGGTVLMHFMLGKALLALTVKELLVAAGVGALVHGACATVLQTNLEKELGHLQKSRFFALACDELGLPRQHPAGEPPDTGLQVTVNRDGICLRELKLRRESLDGTALKEMQQQLETL